MNVLEAIYGRRAVREYAKRPIEPETIAALIDAAIQAPNAMNRQAWFFVSVVDADLLNRIAAEAKAYRLAILERNPELEPLRAHLQDPAFDIFYGAPALVLIGTSAPDAMAVYDCCLAAQNLMLAAHGKGLGSCWIGFAEAWMASEQGRAVLGLAESERPVAPIILGHPSRPPPPPGRKPAPVRWLGREAG